jgi:hypothetical protein
VRLSHDWLRAEEIIYFPASPSQTLAKAIKYARENRHPQQPVLVIWDRIDPIGQPHQIAISRFPKTVRPDVYSAEPGFTLANFSGELHLSKRAVELNGLPEVELSPNVIIYEPLELPGVKNWAGIAPYRSKKGQKVVSVSRLSGHPMYAKLLSIAKPKILQIGIGETDYERAARLGVESRDADGVASYSARRNSVGTYGRSKMYQSSESEDYEYEEEGYDYEGEGLEEG